jgi:hypothetical protein
LTPVEWSEVWAEYREKHKKLLDPDVANEKVIAPNAIFEILRRHGAVMHHLRYS